MWADRTGDQRIERRVLHGNRDMGDLYGFVTHGYKGIAECKDYRTYSPADLERWKGESLDERENADADFVMLMVNEPGVGEKRFWDGDSVYMTVRDLFRVSGLDALPPKFPNALDEWVRVTQETAYRLYMGEEPTE